MALCKKQFPGLDIQIASPHIQYAKYANSIIDTVEMINLIVGEMDRLDKFPAKGFSVAQIIPQNIRNATTHLIDAGFDKYKLV